MDTQTLKAVGVLSPISPSADDLNLKIQSVKKVWENDPPLSTVIEHHPQTVTEENSCATSYSRFSSNIDPSTKVYNNSDSNSQNRKETEPSEISFRENSSIQRNNSGLLKNMEHNVSSVNSHMHIAAHQNSMSGSHCSEPLSSPLMGGLEVMTGIRTITGLANSAQVAGVPSPQTVIFSSEQFFNGSLESEDINDQLDDAIINLYKDLQTENTNLKNKCARLMSEKEELENDVKNFKVAITSLQNEKFATLSNQASKANKKGKRTISLTQLRQKHAQVTSQKVALSKDNKKLMKEIKEWKRQIACLTKSHEVNTVTIATLQKELAKIKELHNSEKYYLQKQYDDLYQKVTLPGKQLIKPSLGERASGRRKPLNATSVSRPTPTATASMAIGTVSPAISTEIRMAAGLPNTAASSHGEEDVNVEPADSPSPTIVSPSATQAVASAIKRQRKKRPGSTEAVGNSLKQVRMISDGPNQHSRGASNVVVPPVAPLNKEQDSSATKNHVTVYEAPVVVIATAQPSTSTAVDNPIVPPAELEILEEDNSDDDSSEPDFLEENGVVLVNLVSEDEDEDLDPRPSNFPERKVEDIDLCDCIP